MNYKAIFNKIKKLITQYDEMVFMYGNFIWDKELKEVSDIYYTFIFNEIIDDEECNRFLKEFLTESSIDTNNDSGEYSFSVLVEDVFNSYFESSYQLRHLEIELLENN